MVKLEIACPGADREPIRMPAALCDAMFPGRPTKGDVFVSVPKVQKLRLTEESEMAIFCSLHSGRDYCMPDLIDRDRREAIAECDEEAANIYNERHKEYGNQIKPGKVKVTQSTCKWDVLIENI